MNTKLLAVVALAAAGAGAAATGGFFALRDTPTQPVAQAATAVSPAPAVEGTEARVEPVAAGPASSPGAAEPERATLPELRRPSTRESKSARRQPAQPSPPVEAAVPQAGRATFDQPLPVPPESVEARPIVEAPTTFGDPLPLVAPVPPEPQYEELIIPADAVVGLLLETSVSSETAHVEDPVAASVTRDVRVGGRVAIPAGARVEGAVTFVEPGGKFKERARLGVRFHTLVLADGATLPLLTETVYREGAAPGNKSAAKIGGAAVGGAVLGAIFGGGKGAAIGGSIGAAGGAAAVMTGDRNPATLAAGTTVTVRLSGPAVITVER